MEILETTLCGLCDGNLSALASISTIIHNKLSLVYRFGFTADLLKLIPVCNSALRPCYCVCQPTPSQAGLKDKVTKFHTIVRQRDALDACILSELSGLVGEAERQAVARDSHRQQAAALEEARVVSGAQRSGCPIENNAKRNGTRFLFAIVLVPADDTHVTLVRWQKE